MKINVDYNEIENVSIKDYDNKLHFNFIELKEIPF